MDILKNTKAGAVIIGRNEGDRLKCCLESVLEQFEHVVYVDSGSSDGSPDHARSLGADVVELAPDTKFTAGKARNAGFEAITKIHQNLTYIQFVDGDCIMSPGWKNQASSFLDDNPSYAIAVGGVSERFPDKSVFNEICDIEWARPTGDVLSCGGIFMVRVDAFASVAGFDRTMIAGEDPELCFRIRQQGYKIFIINQPMALHDADITRLSQWLKRTVRSGYAYAHRYYLHRGSNDWYLVMAQLRIWVWALFVPLFSLGLMAVIGPWALLILALYPLQLYRGYIRTVALTGKKGPSLRYALFNVLGKWPQLAGQIHFLVQSMRHRQPGLIEYK